MSHPLFLQNLAAVLEKLRGLVPDVRVVTEAQKTLFESKNDPSGEQSGVFRAERIAFLPGNVFLP